ncbi:MAG: glycine cleavage system aminomethyltransferase GcvT [Pseudomonadota bacterium]
MVSGRKTPLHAQHVAHGGHMAPFAGWEMPLWYGSAREEHLAVREAVGLFDVSHMGQIIVEGADAEDVVDHLVTGNVKGLDSGEALYTPMLNPKGGIVDDLIVYKRSATDIFICVNAATIEKDFLHMVSHNHGKSVIANLSDRYGQIAIQGPRSKALLARWSPAVAEVLDKPFRFVEDTVNGVEVLVSTTGYTGEWGYEIYAPWADTADIWSRLLELGRDLGVYPVGLTARDTLRLEARLCLYGSDITDETNPIEAGLGWTVDMGREFLGRGVLEGIDRKALPRKLVGFEMIGGGIPRHGYKVFVEGIEVGEVTSGARGPSVGKTIGLAYVDNPHYKRNTVVEIEIRDRRREAKIIRTPFYRRADG